MKGVQKPKHFYDLHTKIFVFHKYYRRKLTINNLKQMKPKFNELAFFKHVGCTLRENANILEGKSLRLILFV